MNAFPDFYGEKIVNGPKLREDYRLPGYYTSLFPYVNDDGKYTDLSDRETAVPLAVNEKDGYKGVDYARLVPLLTEAIKELSSQVEYLK